MAEKNDIFDKKLNLNYGVVQKKEIFVSESNVKRVKEFSSKTMELSKKIKQELKNHTSLDKQIKTKHDKDLIELNKNHKNHLLDIDSKVTGLNTEHQTNLQSSLDKFESEINKTIKLSEELKINNEKLIDNTLKSYNKDIKNCEIKISSINEKADKDINNLIVTLKVEQEKYETFVVNLNEKRNDKLEKVKTACNKKEEKFQDEIDKVQTKTDKAIIELDPPYKESLNSFEDKLSSEKEKYTSRENAVKSTLDSKVARHEKFMSKSSKDNDQRAVKQHKKEINVLEKNAERELKLLAKEHGDKYGVLNNSKKELINSNLRKIASFEIDFINFKEERLYQIKLCKSTLKDDLKNTALKTKQQLEGELNKYNEYLASNERQQAEVTKLREMDVEKQHDTQRNLEISLDKTNQVNVVRHQETLAIKTSDSKSAGITKELDEALLKLVLEVELSKLENERKVADKELIQSTNILKEKEAIEYHKNDFNKQASINSESLDFQKELTLLFCDRANLLSEYEELEINNRVTLKQAFLEKQKVLLSKDFETVVKKINQVFETEKAMFDSEINKFAKQALENLSEFEKVSSKDITTMVEKRNAFNPRAYKKEIKVLDREISDKKEKFRIELEKRKATINSKTAVFNKGTESATLRRDKVLQEIETLNHNEQSRLDNAIELIKRELSDESININERLSSTVNDSNTFTSQAIERSKMMTEENTSYQIVRVEKEEGIVKEIKTLFQSEIHTLTNELEQILIGLENNRSESKSETQSKNSSEAKALDAKVNDFDEKVKNQNRKAEELVDNQKIVYQKNSSKIDLTYNNHLTRVSNELTVKVENYKAKTVEIDRATKEEQRSFENDKKQVQKDYDLSLSKGLSIINQKLQQDLKNI